MLADITIEKVTAAPVDSRSCGRVQKQYRLISLSRLVSDKSASAWTTTAATFYHCSTSASGVLSYNCRVESTAGCLAVTIPTVIVVVLLLRRRLPSTSTATILLLLLRSLLDCC